MSTEVGELISPPRILLTPGPSLMDPRVYRAMSAPIVGHLDPWFTALMSEVQLLLRRVFQTENKVTFPISASGSGGIETAVVNSLEPGDEAIVCINGAFSERMAIIAERTSAKIHRVEAPFGHTVDPEDVRRVGKDRNIKIVGMVHGETSTGVLTQIDPFRKVADELGALLVVDTVASLVGTPLDVDRQRIDICFAGTQKAISAPPGMAPITVNARVEEVIRARKTKVSSWYFDLTPIMTYWGKERTYHHTPPIPLVFGLREALRIVLEEGLEASWERHRQNQLALIAGVEAMGLQLFVADPAERMPTVTAIVAARGRGRTSGSPPVARRIHRRNRRRHRHAEGQTLARRFDGFLEPEAPRAAVPRGAGKGAGRSEFQAARGRRRHRGVAFLFADGRRSRRAPQVTDTERALCPRTRFRIKVR